MKRFATMAAAMAMLGCAAAGAERTPLYGSGANPDGDAMGGQADLCPYQYGPAWNAGCPSDVGVNGDPVPPGEEVPDYGPPTDTDGDGIPDDDDECPTQSGYSDYGGCDGMTVQAINLADRYSTLTGYCNGSTMPICDWWFDATIAVEDWLQEQADAAEDRAEDIAEQIEENFEKIKDLYKDVADAAERAAKEHAALMTPPDCPDGYHAHSYASPDGMAVYYSGSCINTCMVAAAAQEGVSIGLAFLPGTGTAATATKVIHKMVATGNSAAGFALLAKCGGEFFVDPED